MLWRRLAVLSSSVDASVRLGAAKAQAQLLAGPVFRNEWKKDAVAAVTPAMVACFGRQASDAEISTGLDIAEKVVRWDLWQESPRTVLQTVVSGLRFAGDARHRTAAARLLAAMYERDDTHGPETKGAMEKALKQIMERGSTADQVKILCAQLLPRKHKAATAEKLERFLLDGIVPQEMEAEAIRPFRRRSLSPGLGAYLLERFTDLDERAEVRESALDVLLNADKGQIEDIVDALEECLLANDHQYPGLDRLCWWTRYELNKVRREGRDEPSWAKKARAIGLRLADDTSLSAEQRLEGIDIYIAASGPQAGETIENVILDKTRDLPSRCRAAETLRFVVGPPTLFHKLVKQYDSLPPKLVVTLISEGLVLSEAGGNLISSSLKMPGGKAFFFQALKDQRIRPRMKTDVFLRLNDPEILEALAKDDSHYLNVRAFAAGRLSRASAETDLYATMAGKYDSLPYALRMNLACSAGRSPKATGAVEFVIRFLKDEDMKYVRWRVIQSMDLPLTPELKAALQALENDPQLAQQIQRLIQRLEQKQQEQKERN